MTNTSTKTARNVKLVLAGSTELYDVQRRVIHTPALVPGLQYTFDIPVVCLNPETGLCGDIRINLVRMGVSRLLITATIAMPVSELDDE